VIHIYGVDYYECWLMSGIHLLCIEL